MITSNSSTVEVVPSTPRALQPATPPAADKQVRRALFQGTLRRSIDRQHGFEPLRVEGQLPDALRGTLLRNGPGQFEQFGQHYAHSFEGDGLTSALRLQGGQALGACRLTASKGLLSEQSAGRMLFGTSLPWRKRFANVLRGRHKNTANTHVISWQGRVLALMEAARPTELLLDAADIHTVGETDLGVLGPSFSAHPHRVAARKSSYNFGIEYGRNTRLALYELPDVGPARRIGEVPLGFAPTMHDFIATQRHLIFFLSPAVVHVPRMLLQLGDFTKLFGFRPELGTEVIVVPIDTPSEIVRFKVDAFYQWHFANAYEEGGELVVDYVRYEDFSSFIDLSGRAAAELAGGKLHRARIDLARKRMQSDALFDRDVEFPRIDPRLEGSRHGTTWLAADDLRSVLAHRASGEHASFSFGERELVSEPIFVPAPAADARGEDAGWVLALIYDQSTDLASLAVFDAQRVEDGPIARAFFDHHIPMTFHGSWIPG